MAQQQLPQFEFRKDLNINPDDEKFAFIPWKGTTIYRKTMNKSHIISVPREFVNNTFTFGKGTINKLSKFNNVNINHVDEEASDNNKDNDGVENAGHSRSPSNTVRNSFEGDNMMMGSNNR